MGKVADIMQKKKIVQYDIGYLDISLTSWLFLVSRWLRWIQRLVKIAVSHC